jgi:hypothetical protein
MPIQTRRKMQCSSDCGQMLRVRAEALVERFGSPRSDAPDARR